MKTVHYSIIAILAITLFLVSHTAYASDQTSTAYGGLVGYHTADFKTYDSTFQIWYKITNGTVTSTPLDLYSKSLMFFITTSNNGQLIVNLPRSIIDSRNENSDKPFFVTVHKIAGISNAIFSEINDTYVRTLKINFTKDTSEIEISGNLLAPKYSLSKVPSVENENPPVIITQVELGSPLVLLPDNQSCTSPPDPKLTNNCLVDRVSGHNVECSYFLGSSTCEPLHHWTSGTNQSCLDGFPQSGAPQWFDMYNSLDMVVNVQNFTAFNKLNYGPYGVMGPFQTNIELKPHEKCTFPWLPADQALSIGLNNMSMAISYNYDGKHYNASTPSFSDVYNDTRTWQFDGNKWNFAQNETGVGNLLPIGTPFKSTLDPPLKQFKSGVTTQNITCKEGFVLAIKKYGHQPACVNPDTVPKLVLSGWSENPLNGLLVRYGNQTQANLVFFDIMNEPKIRDWSMKGWRYSDYSYASNGETHQSSATVHLYLPSNIGKHGCENGSYGIVVINLNPFEIEHNRTEVGCEIVTTTVASVDPESNGK
jgi:hypothetical protein